MRTAAATKTPPADREPRTLAELLRWSLTRFDDQGQLSRADNAKYVFYWRKIDERKTNRRRR